MEAGMTCHFGDPTARTIRLTGFKIVFFLLLSVSKVQIVSATLFEGQRLQDLSLDPQPDPSEACSALETRGLLRPLPCRIRSQGRVPTPPPSILPALQRPNLRHHDGQAHSVRRSAFLGSCDLQLTPAVSLSSTTTSASLRNVARSARSLAQWCGLVRLRGLVPPCVA